MDISLSTNSYSGSNINLIENNSAVKGKSKKHNTINNTNTSLRVNSKKNSILKSLMEQKENLEKSKNEFMENASKQGTDPKTIQEKLKEYDKKIEAIDKQISELQLGDQRKALNTEGKDKDKNKNSKQTSAAVSNSTVKTDRSMDNIVVLSSGLTKYKDLSHLKNKMKGNIRELKADIEYDEKFRNIDPKSLKRDLDREEAGLKNLDKELSNSLKNINNKIKESIKNDGSQNNLHKNEENKNINTIETTDEDKAQIKQMKIIENIKHYSDAAKDKREPTGEKLNASA